jgi:hypothetical protein
MEKDAKAMMRIQILPFTLMRFRILPFTLMRIRIQLLKMMRIHADPDPQHCAIATVSGLAQLTICSHVCNLIWWNGSVRPRPPILCEELALPPINCLAIGLLTR